MDSLAGIYRFPAGISTCVGLLKEPQKFQIQFLELHVDFYIVDNAELPTSARRRARGEFCIVHNRKADMLIPKTEFEISVAP